MDWIPGLQLAREFFHHAVEPIIERYYPALHYSAALIDSGSEVLGFDTEMSADHGWGPRVMLFLSDEDHAALADQLSNTLAKHLPPEFMGFSTNWTPPDAETGVSWLLDAPQEQFIKHRVEIYTFGDWFQSYLGLDPREEITPIDWLTLPGQKLRTTTSGGMFRDDSGTLSNIRHKLAFYPHDVWLYMMASAWAAVGEDEHLMPRAGNAGDEVGSALIGARLVKTLMQLCFYQERHYPPYHKWFGTAFRQLKCADTVYPLLQKVLTASDWPQREMNLSKVYELMAQKHNALNLTSMVRPTVQHFFSRPFLVLYAGRFADALHERIHDPQLQELFKNTQIGAVEQFTDNTNLLSHTANSRRARWLYQDPY